MEKKALVVVLDEMGTLLELQGANPFKARAYHNASRVIEGITQDIETLVQSGEILEIDGIGKTIAAVISDLVKEGKSKEHDQLRRSTPGGVLEMLKIQGLGPKKVKLLYEKLRIKSIDDLEKAAKGEKLATLAGFGKKSAENILKGIAALRRVSAKSLYPNAPGRDRLPPLPMCERLRYFVISRNLLGAWTLYPLNNALQKKRKRLSRWICSGICQTWKRC